MQLLNFFGQRAAVHHVYFTPWNSPKRQLEDWKLNRLLYKDHDFAPKSQTVTKELRTLKAILNKAVQWGNLVRNSITHVEAPKRLDSKLPRFCTIEGRLDIYAACSAGHRHCRIVCCVRCTRGKIARCRNPH